MSLLDANWCPQAAAVLHNGKELSPKELSRRKAIYLEGLVRFMEIYAQTEIGGEVELDIAKIALFTNSAAFENDDLYHIKTVENVYEICESLAILGLPLWRFLRLSDYQKKIFESGYNELLISAKKAAGKEHPCFACVWYEETDTMFGPLRRCKKPDTDNAWRHRQGPHIPENIKECKWLTTLDSLPEAVKKMPSGSPYDSRTKEYFLRDVERAREKFKKELQKDPFRIPKEMSEDEIVDLEADVTRDELMLDFAFAFKNKRTITERRRELQRAMVTEGMIRFFETYAQTEYGSDYVADIKNIALYTFNMENDELSNIRSYEDLYQMLENMVFEKDIKKFVKQNT